MSDVSTVQQINAHNNALNGGAGSAKASAVDYEAFLALLVAQLKHQDPTAPTDSGEFLSQLASFSGVEQQVQTNEKLDALISDNSMVQASDLIDRTVISADGTQSGVVESVILSAGGTIAVLEDGTEIRMGDGVVIRR